MTIIDVAYKNLAQRVLQVGYDKDSRVGPTRSLPGMSIVTPPIGMEFPILTTRKIFYKGVLGELAAFIQGATTVKEFKNLGCNYWGHNASQWVGNVGVPEEDQKVGRIYGAQWRSWGVTNLDQMKVLIDGIKADPHGRRHLLTTWNPEELDEMCLPPCHLLAQFYVHGNMLDCIVYMRSVDIALGLPSDLVLYGALLALVAKEVGMVAGQLHMQFGDAHIYAAHIPQLSEQLKLKGSLLSPFLSLAPSTRLLEFHPSQATMTNYVTDEVIQYELF